MFDDSGYPPIGVIQLVTTHVIKNREVPEESSSL